MEEVHTINFDEVPSSDRLCLMNQQKNAKAAFDKHLVQHLRRR